MPRVFKSPYSKIWHYLPDNSNLFSVCSPIRFVWQTDDLQQKGEVTCKHCIRKMNQLEKTKRVTILGQDGNYHKV